MKAVIKKWLINNGFDDEFLCNYQEVGGKPEGGTLSEVIEGCMADIGPKWISLNGIEPDEIVNGSTYIWDVGNNKLLVSATLDCLIAFHDDSVWPYRDRLLGGLYGPINVNTND